MSRSRVVTLIFDLDDPLLPGACASSTSDALPPSFSAGRPAE